MSAQDKFDRGFASAFLMCLSVASLTLTFAYAKQMDGAEFFAAAVLVFVAALGSGVLAGLDAGEDER